MTEAAARYGSESVSGIHRVARARGAWRLVQGRAWCTAYDHRGEERRIGEGLIAWQPEGKDGDLWCLPCARRARVL